MKFLPAAVVLAAFGAAPGLAQAAGQPQLDSQESVATTNGKAPDQAVKDKMDAKQERDTQKYQDRENARDDDKLAGSKSGDTGMRSTAPGYETESAIDGGVGKSSGRPAPGQSGGKRPPP
jgi:hypothetical protein